MCAGARSPQPSGDHQVQHNKVLALEGQHDALAETVHGDDAPSLDGCERRHRGAQYERTDQAHALE